MIANVAHSAFDAIVSNSTSLLLQQLREAEAERDRLERRLQTLWDNKPQHPQPPQLPAVQGLSDEIAAMLLRSFDATLATYRRDQAMYEREQADWDKWVTDGQGKLDEARARIRALREAIDNPTKSACSKHSRRLFCFCFTAKMCLLCICFLH